MDQKSSGRSLAPSRIFQTQTVFDLSGNVLSSGPLASTTGKMIDPDIKPIYTDEILVGYATPFAEAYSLDVFFMSRDDAQLHRGCAVAPERHGARQRTVRRRQSAVRRVRRVPVGGRPAHLPRRHGRCPAPACRRLDERRQLHVEPVRRQFRSRLLARSRSFNTSSFIQDGPGTNVEDPNRFGPLFEDRPHVFKVFTLVRGDQPSDRVGLPARAERDAVGGARPRLGGRGAELSRAGRQPPQPDVGEPRCDGRVPPAAQRRARASRSKRAC